MKIRSRYLIGAVAILALLVLALPKSLQGTNPEHGNLLNTARDRNSVAQHDLAVQNMSTMPLAFTKNNGQWDDRVLFRANAGGAAMWFTREGICYQFTRRVPKVSETGVKGVGGAACCAQGRASPAPTGRSGRRACQPLG